jgi:riboflavin biosynthesis pyrimidine reductase
VITSFLLGRLVDRLIVAVAPLVIGSGTSAVGHFDIMPIADGIRLVNRAVRMVGDDVLMAWDIHGTVPRLDAN